MTVRSIEVSLGLTNQGGHNLIRNAENRGWLNSLGTHGRGGRERWYSPEIVEVIESPMAYGTSREPTGGG